MYRAITTTNIIPHNHIIWKLKLPLKIKIFMWYLIKGVTLTKDNLARQRWKGSLNCCCCSLIETIQHLFFDCQNAKFLWRLISVVFNLPMPLNVNHMFTHWRPIRLLQKEEERPPVLEGCHTLECLAMEVFATNGWPFNNRIAYV